MEALLSWIMCVYSNKTWQLCFAPCTCIFVIVGQLQILLIVQNWASLNYLSFFEYKMIKSSYLLLCWEVGYEASISTSAVWQDSITATSPGHRYIILQIARLISLSLVHFFWRSRFNTYDFNNVCICWIEIE